MYHGGKRTLALDFRMDLNQCSKRSKERWAHNKTIHQGSKTACEPPNLRDADKGKRRWPAFRPSNTRRKSPLPSSGSNVARAKLQQSKSMLPVDRGTSVKTSRKVDIQSYRLVQRPSLLALIEQGLVLRGEVFDPRPKGHRVPPASTKAREAVAEKARDDSVKSNTHTVSVRAGKWCKCGFRYTNEHIADHYRDNTAQRQEGSSKVRSLNARSVSPRANFGLHSIGPVTRQKRSSGPATSSRRPKVTKEAKLPHGELKKGMAKFERIVLHRE